MQVIREKGKVHNLDLSNETAAPKQSLTSPGPDPPPSPAVVPFWPTTPSLARSYSNPIRAPRGKVGKSASLGSMDGPKRSSQQNAATSAEIETLEGQLSAKTQKVLELTEEVGKLVEQSEQLQKGLENLANGKVEVERQVAQRDEALAALEAELEKEKGQRRELIGQMERLEAEHNDAIGKHRSVSGQLAELQREVEHAGEREAELAGQVSALQKEKTDLQGFQVELQDRVEKLEGELEKASEVQAQLVRELEVERSTLHKWKSVIAAALKQKLEHAQTMIEEQRTRRETAESQVAELQASRKELELKVLSLEAELAAAGSQLAILVEGANGVPPGGKFDVSGLEVGEAGGATGVATAGRGQTDEDKEVVAKLREEIEDLAKRMEAAEKRAAAARESLEAAQEEKDKIQQEASEDLEKMKKEIAALQEEKDKLEEARAAAMMTAAKASENQIQELQEQIEAGRQEMETLKAHPKMRDGKSNSSRKSLEHMEIERQLAALVAEKELKLAEWEVLRESLNAELAEARAHLAEARTELEEVRRQLEGQDTAELGLSAKLAAVEGERAEAESRLVTSTKDISMVSQTPDNGIESGVSREMVNGEPGNYLTRELDRKKEELESKGKELVSLKEERDWLKAKVFELEGGKGMVQTIFPWCACIHDSHWHAFTKGATTTRIDKVSDTDEKYPPRAQ